MTRALSDPQAHVSRVGKTGTSLHEEALAMTGNPYLNVWDSPDKYIIGDLADITDDDRQQPVCGVCNIVVAPGERVGTSGPEFRHYECKAK